MDKQTGDEIPCDDIISHYLSGSSLEEIAEKYGCSRGTIRRRLIRQNIKIRPRGGVGVYREGINAESVGFIIGMLCGDSNFSSRRKNKGIDTEHSTSQEMYLLWKFNKLKTIIGGKMYRRDRFDKRTNKIYHSVSYHSATHPVINQLYSEFIRDGTKQLTNELLEKLTPEGIAVWFCDDGNLYNYPKGYLRQLTLATNAFNNTSRRLILEMFRKKYGLQFSESKSNNSIRITNINGIQKFYSIFGKYIPPCMEYKNMVVAT